MTTTATQDCVAAAYVMKNDLGPIDAAVATIEGGANYFLASGRLLSVAPSGVCTVSDPSAQAEDRGDRFVSDDVVIDHTAAAPAEVHTAESTAEEAPVMTEFYPQAELSALIQAEPTSPPPPSRAQQRAHDREVAQATKAERTAAKAAAKAATVQPKVAKVTKAAAKAATVQPKVAKVTKAAKPATPPEAPTAPLPVVEVPVVPAADPAIRAGLVDAMRTALDLRTAAEAQLVQARTGYKVAQQAVALYDRKPGSSRSGTVRAVGSFKPGSKVARFYTCLVAHPEGVSAAVLRAQCDTNYLRQMADICSKAGVVAGFVKPTVEGEQGLWKLLQA